MGEFKYFRIQFVCNICRLCKSDTTITNLDNKQVSRKFVGCTNTSDIGCLNSDGLFSQNTTVGVCDILTSYKEVFLDEEDVIIKVE